MIANIARLVNLTTLHDRTVPKHVSQRLANRLAAVDDEEQRLGDAKTSLDEVRE